MSDWGGTDMTGRQQQQQQQNGPPLPQYQWRGQQYDGNKGGQYVDQTGNYDANGNLLSDQQKAYWKQFDANRASMNMQMSGGHQDGQAGKYQNALYNKRTQTWSVYDGKAWKDGVDQANLYDQLSDNLKKQYPAWYWGDQAEGGDQAELYQNNMEIQHTRTQTGMNATGGGGPGRYMTTWG